MPAPFIFFPLKVPSYISLTPQLGLLDCRIASSMPLARAICSALLLHKFFINILMVIGKYLSVDKLSRAAGNRKPSKQFRADADDLMSFYIAFNLFGIIISAVIFTIFAKQTGADHYFHFCFPHFDMLF